MQSSDNWDTTLYDTFNNDEYTSGSPDGYNSLVDEVMNESAP